MELIFYKLIPTWSSGGTWQSVTLDNVTISQDETSDNKEPISNILGASAGWWGSRDLHTYQNMYVQIKFSSPKKVYAIELQTSTLSSTDSSCNAIAVETDIICDGNKITTIESPISATRQETVIKIYPIGNNNVSTLKLYAENATNYDKSNAYARYYIGKIQLYGR